MNDFSGVLDVHPTSISPKNIAEIGPANNTPLPTFQESPGLPAQHDISRLLRCAELPRDI